VFFRAFSDYHFALFLDGPPDWFFAFYLNFPSCFLSAVDALYVYYFLPGLTFFSAIKYLPYPSFSLTSTILIIVGLYGLYRFRLLLAIFLSNYIWLGYVHDLTEEEDFFLENYEEGGEVLEDELDYDFLDDLTDLFDYYYD
jgi:hypothetical protein